MKADDGYFRIRLGEAARYRGYDYKTLHRALMRVDPTGRGISLKKVSEHLNQKFADRIDGRTAYLYCTVLDCSMEDIWELQQKEVSRGI